jgi:hypothetical protein
MRFSKTFTRIASTSRSSVQDAHAIFQDVLCRFAIALSRPPAAVPIRVTCAPAPFASQEPHPVGEQSRSPGNESPPP